MNKEKKSSGQGTTKNMYSVLNKTSSDSSRRIKVSARIDKPILEEIEDEHENRSEGIRQALKEKYGRGEA